MQNATTTTAPIPEAIPTSFKHWALRLLFSLNKFWRVLMVALVLTCIGKFYFQLEDRRLANLTIDVQRDLSKWNIKVRNIGNTLVLEGVVYYERDRDQILSIARAYQNQFTFRSLIESPKVISSMDFKPVVPVGWAEVAKPTAPLAQHRPSSKPRSPASGAQYDAKAAKTTRPVARASRRPRTR